MNPYQVILKTVVSEKSHDQRDHLNKYTFIVDRNATKTDVKRAVELLFAVKVDTVHTAIRAGKMVRRGRFMARKKAEKKAIVSLQADAKLPIFDNE